MYSVYVRSDNNISTTFWKCSLPRALKLFKNGCWQTWKIFFSTKLGRAFQKQETFKARPCKLVWRLWQGSGEHSCPCALDCSLSSPPILLILAHRFWRGTQGEVRGRGHPPASQISLINPGDQCSDGCCSQIPLTPRTFVPHWRFSGMVGKHVSELWKHYFSGKLK